MKILWFVDKQFDSAPDRVTWIEMIKHLQRGHEVHLVTGYSQNQRQFDELDCDPIYVTVPRRAFLNRIALYRTQMKKLEGLIDTIRPDIVLFNTVNFLILKKANALRARHAYRTFLDVRTLPVSSSLLRNRLDGGLLKSSLQVASRDCDGITYITGAMERYCRGAFRLPVHRSAVWTSGVDVDLFQPAETRRDERVFRLIYHGTIADNRGLDNVVKALDLLKKHNVELFLLGRGNGVVDLKRRVVKLGLTHKVTFHPPVPHREVPDYINQADVGILPFPDWQGWNTSSPIKLFEYLACGKSVIVTRIPAHTDVLRGCDFAFWAETSTPEGIACAIRRAYAEREQSKKLGARARDLVTCNYTWERQAQELAQFVVGERVDGSGASTT